MRLIEVTSFQKADYQALDDQFPQWNQNVNDAVNYIENAFKRGWNQDAAWQAFMLAAMNEHKDELIKIRTISATELYDTLILPFYDKLGMQRPPNSRRSNFAGGRLGNMFNNKGPFVFGGTTEDGRKLPKHMWTLKPAYLQPHVWKVIEHYWNLRLKKGFSQSSRAKRAEDEAGKFLAGQHAGFSRTDVDFRAQDAGVDGRASFRGKWVPSQVKEFPVSENEVHAYMKVEPAYKKGGAIIAPKFKTAAVEYIKKQLNTYHIDFSEIIKKDILTGKSQTKVILMWQPKSSENIPEKYENIRRKSLADLLKF